MNDIKNSKMNNENNEIKVENDFDKNTQSPFETEQDFLKQSDGNKATSCDETKQSDEKIMKDEEKPSEKSNDKINTEEKTPIENCTDNVSLQSQDLEEQVLELTKQVEQLTDELARIRADQYNLQQEYTNYVRRSKNEIPTYKNAGIEEVINALLTVFDDIDAAKKHGDLLDGPFASIANKMETILKNSFDVQRFAQIKDEFDPNMHEALLVTPNPAVLSEEIGEIVQSGWKISDRVIRAAKVVVFAPSE